MAVYELALIVREEKRGNALRDAGRDMDKLGSKANKNGRDFKDYARAAAAVGAALGTVAIAANKGYQALEEGAALELAQRRFDSLAGSIGTTADALQTKMKEATRGMLSNAELMYSATDIIGLGLADNEQDVVRLARLVGELGWNMQQVILTFANDSKLRLDALGLSVSEVTKYAKEFEEQGIAATKAFDMAVLKAGEERLNLMGSAAGSAAGDLASLRAEWENMGNDLKLWLSGAVGPSLAVISGREPQAMQQRAEEAGAAAQSVTELATAYRRLREEGDELAKQDKFGIGYFKEVRPAIQDASLAMAQELAKMTDGAQDFDTEARRVFGASGLSLMMNRFNLTTVTALRESVLAADEAGMALKDFLEIARGSGVPVDEYQQFARALHETAGADEALRNIAYGMDQVGEGAGNFLEAKDAVEKYKDELESIAAWEDLRGGLVTGADLVYEQELEAYKKSQQALKDHLKALDNIQQSGLDRQFDIIDQLAEQWDIIAEQPNEWTDAYIEATATVDELNAELADSFDQMVLDMITSTDGFDQVAADYAVAAGLMSQEQADLKLRAIEASDAMRDVGVAIDNSALSYEQGVQIVDAFSAAIQDSSRSVDQLVKDAEDSATLFAAGDWLMAGAVRNQEQQDAFDIEITPTVNTENVEALRDEMYGLGDYRDENLNAIEIAPPVNTEHIDSATEAAGLASDALTTMEGDYPVEVPNNFETARQGLQAIDSLLRNLPTQKTVTVDYITTGRAPGRAHGGPVSAGMPYFVGENGRELFVPGADGAIVPNHQLAAAGGVGAQTPGGNVYNVNTVQYLSSVFNTRSGQRKAWQNGARAFADEIRSG